MERKFTDDEIVKALNCCGSGNCRGCPYWDYKCHGGNQMIRDALGLINRQKAEVEKLTEQNKILMDRVDNLNEYIIYAENINNLAKEMTGENNGN